MTKPSAPRNIHTFQCSAVLCTAQYSRIENQYTTVQPQHQTFLASHAPDFSRISRSRLSRISRSRLSMHLTLQTFYGISSTSKMPYPTQRPNPAPSSPPGNPRNGLSLFFYQFLSLFITFITFLSFSFGKTHFSEIAYFRFNSHFIHWIPNPAPTAAPKARPTMPPADRKFLISDV